MLKPFDPTPEQRGVIESPDRSVIVTAAAGAGKTAVLVSRYLKHVEDGLEPGQILTITFTKKAAAEMKQRIVAKLRDQGRLDAAQAAETGPIQTIHSFCERLLRENALEAGVDPRFDIASEAESAAILERAIRDAITVPAEEAPEADRIISFLAGQRKYGAGTSPYSMIEWAVREILERLRGSGYGLAEIEARCCDPATLECAFEQEILTSLPLPVSTFVRRSTGASLGERIREGYREWGQKAPRWAAAKYSEEGNRQALEHTAGLFQLVAAVWSTVEREMDREQKLDFTALEQRALALIEGSTATRERVGRQYRVVMLDEAQDVNPIQHQILQAMQIESELIVGDLQQSIYGFRLADPKIFKDILENADPKQLSINKRSEPGVLRFVDLIFGSIFENYTPMTPPPSPVDLEDTSLPAYPGIELWLQERLAISETARLTQQMYEEHKPALKDVAILVRHAKYAQQMHIALRSLGIPSRIAGGSEKFYARLEIRDLANTLRALANPYDDFAMLAMLHSPVVGLSLDAVSLLALQSPVIESLSGFESPVEEDLPRLARFLEWFMPLRAFADRMSAWEALSEFFAVSDYLAAVGRGPNPRQVLANIRKLLRLAAQEHELGPLEYAERIRDIQRLAHREGDAPAEDERADLITIMTIHKAKGLEWPVVIVPEMHHSIGRRFREVEADARLGLAATQFGTAASLYHSWLEDRRCRREAEEEMRLLYVAFTRAKSRLCVVAHASAKADSPAKRIASIAGVKKARPAGFEYREPETAPPSDEAAPGDDG